MPHLLMRIVPFENIHVVCVLANGKAYLRYILSKNLPALFPENFPSVYDTAPLTMTVFIPAEN
jgi:hypothetical protein